MLWQLVLICERRRNALAPPVGNCVDHPPRQPKLDGCALGEMRFARASLPPIRQQLVQRAGLEHVAAEDVRPGLGTFLHDADLSIHPKL